MMDVADTKPSHLTKPTQELSSVVVPLLKGVLYEQTDEKMQPFPELIPMRLNPGTPMGDGKILLYDDNHRIVDTSNGVETTVSPYNLATMTDTLFTINYKPFFRVKDDGSNEFGDQKIVVDIPSYGFKLANPGAEGVQFEKITMLDVKGNVYLINHKNPHLKY